MVLSAPQTRLFRIRMASPHGKPGVASTLIGLVAMLLATLIASAVRRKP